MDVRGVRVKCYDHQLQIPLWLSSQCFRKYYVNDL